MGRVGRVTVLAVLAWGVLAWGVVGAVAWAEPPTFQLTIRNHRFEPAELTVPAGKTIKLVVHNADPTPEEFESQELNREKIVPGGSSIFVYLSAMSPGTYGFFGDFHQATAKGHIIAK